MKVIIDENEDVDIIAPPRTLFGEHLFCSAKGEGLLATPDVQIFDKMAARGYDAIITQDRNQLAKQEERDKPRESGLHWIGHRQPKANSLLRLATTTAAYVAAFPHILDYLLPKRPPTAFHVRNLELEAAQRVKARPL